MGEQKKIAEQSRAVTERKRIVRGFAAATLVMVIWCGFNIVSRYGGRSPLTPFDMTAMRLGVSGLLFCPVFIWGRRSATLLQTTILAAVGGLSYGIFVYAGFAFAPAAHAGILVNGGIPFATALVSWAVLGYRPGRRALLALLLAGLGIAIIGIESFSGGIALPRQWLGDLFFVAAAISFAGFGLLIKRWRVPPLEATAGVATLSALIYLPVYFLFLPKALSAVAMPLILMQCFYQGVLAASLAFAAYSYANQTIGPIKASLMLALVPGLSALMAVPLLGEPLHATTVVGVVLVTCGALLGATNQPARRD